LCLARCSGCLSSCVPLEARPVRLRYPSRDPFVRRYGWPVRIARSRLGFSLLPRPRPHSHTMGQGRRACGRGPIRSDGGAGAGDSGEWRSVVRMGWTVVTVGKRRRESAAVRAGGDGRARRARRRASSLAGACSESGPGGARRCRGRLNALRSCRVTGWLDSQLASPDGRCAIPAGAAGPPRPTP
jgi:hypothetical protein